MVTSGVSEVRGVTSTRTNAPPSGSGISTDCPPTGKSSTFAEVVFTSSETTPFSVRSSPKSGPSTAALTTAPTIPSLVKRKKKAASRNSITRRPPAARITPRFSPDTSTSLPDISNENRSAVSSLPRTLSIPSVISTRTNRPPVGAASMVTVRPPTSSETSASVELTRTDAVPLRAKSPPKSGPVTTALTAAPASPAELNRNAKSASSIPRIRVPPASRMRSRLSPETSTTEPLAWRVIRSAVRELSPIASVAGVSICPSPVVSVPVTSTRTKNPPVAAGGTVNCPPSISNTTAAEVVLISTESVPDMSMPVPGRSGPTNAASINAPATPSEVNRKEKSALVTSMIRVAPALSSKLMSSPVSRTDGPSISKTSRSALNVLSKTTSFALVSSIRM